MANYPAFLQTKLFLQNYRVRTRVLKNLVIFVIKIGWWLTPLSLPKDQMDYYLLVKNSLFFNLFSFIEYVLDSFPISLTVLKLQKHQLHIIICLFVMKYIKIYMPCYHFNNLNKTVNFKKTFLRFFI